MGLPKIQNNLTIINEYIIYLELQDLKPSTVSARLWSVVPFFKFVEYKASQEVTRADIERFAIFLKKSGKKKSTQRKNLIETRDFFNFAIPNNDFFSGIKFKKEKPDTSKKEYINAADVANMLKFCGSQRDRAFIFLLWESGARLGEILSLNVGDIKPERVGMTVTLTGKTGKRDVWVIDSLPDIQLWLNIQKGKKEDPLFPIHGGRLAIRGAQTIILKLGVKANITGKRVYAHSFRHGKITELSRLGMSEMQLRHFAGWGTDSDMPSVYIHSDSEDVQRRLMELKGLYQNEENVQPTASLSIRECPRCKKNNPFDSKYCSTCSMCLDPIEAVTLTDTAREVNNLKVEMEELKRRTTLSDIMSGWSPEFREKVIEESKKVKK